MGLKNNSDFLQGFAAVMDEASLSNKVTFVRDASDSEYMQVEFDGEKLSNTFYSMAAEHDCRTKGLYDDVVNTLLRDIVLPLREVDPSATSAALKYLKDNQRIESAYISKEESVVINKIIPALK